MEHFIADPHLDHLNIIEHCARPFPNKDEMNEVLIENWNKVVAATDDVYVIGDVVWSSRPNRIQELTKRLNGRKFLLPGNHDPDCLVDRIGCNDVCGFYEILPALVDMELTRTDGKPQKLTLCHYPLRVWNKSHKGSWHLFGHVHDGLHDLPVLSMDVGVDAQAARGMGYRPISWLEVQAYMTAREETLRRHKIDPWWSQFKKPFAEKVWKKQGQQDPSGRQ